MGRHLIAPTLIMTDVNSKPLAGFKTTARVLGTVITFRLKFPAQLIYFPAQPFSNARAKAQKQ
jgi:hypothetical protein